MLGIPLLSLIFILGIVVVALLAWGSFNVCSGFYIKTRCRGKSNDNKIALSFDDGPHKEITPQVLELLKKHGIKAGFFLVGSHVKKNKDLLTAILEDGHIVGNHSYSHKNSYGFFGSQRVLKDLQNTEALIYHVSGKRTRLFRPPFGVSNPNIAWAVRKLDYVVIGWSIRSLDTMRKDRQKTINRVIRRLKAGSLILFHDTHTDIIPILEAVIKYAGENGFEFVSPDALLNTEPYK